MEISRESLDSLEFDFVREMLAERTVTPMGRPLALALAPLPDPDDVSVALDETDEAVSLLETHGGLPLRGVLPIDEILEEIRPEGSVLSGVQVLAVVRFCAVVDDARAFRGRLKESCPLIAARLTRLPDLESILRAISGRISPAGDLEDSASPELARLRGRIQAATAALRSRLEAILARADADKVLRDTFITERGGRFVIPVRSDSPFPVRGIVHGGSSSGATLFIEPMATVDLNNELVQLREEELAETERILRAWTARLRDRLDDLHLAAGEVARLDLAQARALLARDLRAVRPVMEEGSPLALRAARHPLLEKTLAASGGSMVPIDVSIPAGSSTLIVSGPNAGGKTIVLKTTGLLALMAHAGLRVPADEATLPLLKQVLVDIGDRQSIEGSLSTFSAHIQNLSSIASRLTPPCLVLIDEIGTGTDPVEGGALAIALLEWLRAHGALTIATTHHGPVKIYGIETPGVASASVEFDEATLAPTYRLLAGIAGASSGLAIAERLGLDPTIVDAARRRILPDERQGEEYLVRLRELVTALESDRRELERMRVQLEGDARRAREEAIRSDHERAEKFRGELAQALEEFRAKAREQAKGIEDKREAIRLERERMKRETILRREVEGLERAAAPAEPWPQDRPGERAGRGSSRGARRVRAGLAESAPGPGAGTQAPFSPHPGDRVLLGPYGREGRIESIDGDLVTVLVGSARFRVRREECHPPDAESHETPRWKTAPAVSRADALERQAVAREINLIGFTVEEGTEKLDKFLDEAFVAGHPEVRVVHGHGTGRLRFALRELMNRHPHVTSHRPGSPGEGGDGATIALLASR